MPARNAPSANDSPASSVSAASPSVTSSTLSMNSSDERSRATMKNHPCISFWPKNRIAASATAALPAAMASGFHRSAPPSASVGIAIRNATTARSWNSRMPITSRPCGELSSERSASNFDTIAVELIASAPPSAKPGKPAEVQEMQADHRHQGRDRDLRETEPEHRPAHRLELRQAEFEADREHQEDDAEFGQIAHVRVVRHPGQRVRTDRDADGQVAENRRQPHQPAEHDRDDRGGEQQQDQLQCMGHRFACALRTRGDAALPCARSHGAARAPSRM